MNDDLNTRQASEDALPIPEFLIGIRARAAEIAPVSAVELRQAMVSEYSRGNQDGVAWGRAAVGNYGWHIFGQRLPHAA